MAILWKGVVWIPYFSIQSYQKIKPQLLWILMTSNVPGIVESGTTLSVLDCLDEASKHSQMCFYWKIILNFEVLLLIYRQSIREGNFGLYLASLNHMLPWFFALNRHNHAIIFIGLIWNCWSTVVLPSIKNSQQETSQFWRPKNNFLVWYWINSINRTTNTETVLVVQPSLLIDSMTQHWLDGNCADQNFDR